jgi:hypothetical protein
LAETIASEFDEPLFLGNGMYQPDGMMGREGEQFSLDGGKVCCLDLDQQFPADDVDDKALQAYFEPVARLGKPLFQSCMQGFFVQRAYVV